MADPLLLGSGKSSGATVLMFYIYIALITIIKILCSIFIIPVLRRSFSSWSRWLYGTHRLVSVNWRNQFLISMLSITRTLTSVIGFIIEWIPIAWFQTCCLDLNPPISLFSRLLIKLVPNKHLSLLDSTSRANARAEGISLDEPKEAKHLTLILLWTQEMYKFCIFR